MIREIHKRLLDGVRVGSAAPGEYRKVPNYIVNSATREVIYTPPPAHDVPILMTEMVDWLNKESEIHPVLISGIAQFQLVHIHPFLDGNGRTSRLLSTLCLYQAGYDFKRLFTISEFYDRDRSAFYKAIQSVRESDMDMTRWVEYFVEGLATQMDETVERGKKAMRVDLTAKHHKLNVRQARALDFLMNHDGMSIQNYEQLCFGVNRRTLQRDLKEMVEKDLLEAEGATNRLIYRAREAKE
jgi:Fic family protein